MSIFFSPQKQSKTLGDIFFSPQKAAKSLGTDMSDPNLYNTPCAEACNAKSGPDPNKYMKCIVDECTGAPKISSTVTSRISANLPFLRNTMTGAKMPTPRPLPLAPGRVNMSSGPSSSPRTDDIAPTIKPQPDDIAPTIDPSTGQPVAGQGSWASRNVALLAGLGVVLVIAGVLVVRRGR